MDDTPLPPVREDYESGVNSDDRMEVRIWLRLITCTNLIDSGVRQGLHQEYDTTLPRFDILAQLDRAGEALSMGELSRRLMVTNGNITGLIDRLVRDGLVERQPAPNDRRMQLVRLTDQGQTFFADVAMYHRQWVSDMMKDMSRTEMNQLYDLLARLKQSLLDSQGSSKGDDQA